MNDIDLRRCIIFDPVKTLSFLEIEEEMALDGVVSYGYAGGRVMQLKNWRFQMLEVANRYMLSKKMARFEDKY